MGESGEVSHKYFTNDDYQSLLQGKSTLDEGGSSKVQKKSNSKFDIQKIPIAS